MSHTAPNNVQVYNVIAAKNQVLDSEVDGKYFSMENLPADVSVSDRTVLKSVFDRQSEKYDPQSMAFLAQLFINPCIDDVAGDATVELEKDIFRSSRTRSIRFLRYECNEKNMNTWFPGKVTRHDYHLLGLEKPNWPQMRLRS